MDSERFTVASPDTDVLILLLDLVSNIHLHEKTHLQFLTGKGKGRIIDVKQQVQVVGKSKYQALVGFHNFTGADWGCKFVGETKDTWTKVFMALSSDHPVLKCCMRFGEVNIKNALDNAKLPKNYNQLRSSYAVFTVPMDYHLFHSSHLIRSNYVSMRDKSYSSTCPVLPLMEENGWTIKNGI